MTCGKKLLTLTAAVLAASSVVRGASDSPQNGSHYVNMGSSFAAGSGVDPSKPASVERCMQSSASYASLLATRLGLALEDRSCAGATSAHLLEPWNELPEQISAVNDQTKLVTITVGGNDIGYTGNLIAATCDDNEGLIFRGRKFPCFQERRAEEVDYAVLESNLVKAAREIFARAPQAKVIFIQYISLVPDELCEVLSLNEEAANRLRAVGERLAAITATVAKNSGAMLLRMDQLSSGHTACDAEPWSIGAATTADNADGLPWHPNRRANEVIAEQLQRMLVTPETDHGARASPLAHRVTA